MPLHPGHQGWWPPMPESAMTSDTELPKLRAEIERLQAECIVLKHDNERLRAALEMISGRRQCLDGFMSNVRIAEAALDHEQAKLPGRSKESEERFRGVTYGRSPGALEQSTPANMPFERLPTCAQDPGTGDAYIGPTAPVCDQEPDEQRTPSLQSLDDEINAAEREFRPVTERTDGQ